MLAVRRHTRDMAHKIRAETDLIVEMRDGREGTGERNDEVREISHDSRNCVDSKRRDMHSSIFMQIHK